MAGKQVCDVPPTNVGGSLFCIAVSSRGMDIQKVGMPEILITVLVRSSFDTFYYFT